MTLQVRADLQRHVQSTQIADSKKPALDAGFLVFGALDRIRTCDRSVRSRVLYPAELRVQVVFVRPGHRWLKQS